MLGTSKGPTSESAVLVCEALARARRVAAGAGFDDAGEEVVAPKRLLLQIKAIR